VIMEENVEDQLE